MFSATVSTSIEIVADKLLVNPVYVSVGSPSEPNASVKQIVLWVEEQLKKKHLFSLLQDPKHFMPPVVVFVNSKIVRKKAITEKERTSHLLKGDYIVESISEKLGQKYYKMTDYPRRLLRHELLKV